jgi:hypothetical protein
MKASLRYAAFAILASAAISSLAVAASGLLDGKTFEGQCVEKGKAAGTGVPDELRFRDGKFLSTACLTHGCGEAKYTAKTLGKTVTWESTLVSTKASEGTILWKGTVKGDVAEATLVWTKPGQKPSEWTFSGRLKRK